MKNENNIEKIFQDGFENYQPEVNPDIWSNIESQMQSGGNTPPQSDGGSSSVVQSMVKSTQFWVATTIVTVGVVTTLAVMNYFNDDANNSTVTTNNQESTFKENQKDIQKTPQQGSQEEPGKSDQPVVQDTDNNMSATSEAPGSTSPVKHDERSDAAAEESTAENIERTDEQSSESTEVVTTHQETATQQSVNTTTSEKRESKNDESSVDYTRSIVSSAEYYSTGSSSTFRLDNSSEVEKVSWYLNGKRMSSNSSTEIQFEEEGRQLIEAVVVFSNGKEKIYDYTAIVKACSYIGQFEPGSIKSGLGKLPNTFSPNSDGNNDFFSVESKNIASFNIMIFNAKGQMVFGSEKTDFKWDGNDKYGKPLTEKEFRYSLRAVGKDGKRYQTEGQLIIYR